jgi:two-component system, NtrC family, sensor kinase
MGARGLKTKIAVNITVFLLLGMVSIDVVTMLTAQRNLVRNELAKGLTLARILREHILSHAPWDDLAETSRSPDGLYTALIDSGVDCFFLLTRGLQHIVFGTRTCPQDDEIVVQTQKSLAIGEEIVTFSGITFGLFGNQPDRIVISLPLSAGDETEAAISLVIPLASAYRSLRQNHHIQLLYVFVNTVVLSFLGIYRVIKMYLQPLGRLAKRAEEYKEDDELLFSVRKEDNELLRLSSALNALMRRLAEERSKLRETVRSLETANLEIQSTQEEMVRAEKLASVGRLSAGIAHEIGNPLGIVTGYIGLLKQSGTSEDERREYLERAEGEVERINGIIRQLLEISRPSPCGPRPVSVGQVLADLQQMLEVQPFMSRVRVDLRLAATDDTVRADPDRLRQVFLNLAINAADAIAARHPVSGGELSIATSEATEEKAPDGQSPRWLLVRFRDNGAGIPQDSLPCIFDPFYTTKEPGKGTGLGLSVSFMIIQGFGGLLEAESTVGEGTTMTVRLPISSPALAADQSPSALLSHAACRLDPLEYPLEAAP